MLLARAPLAPPDAAAAAAFLGGLGDRRLYGRRTAGAQTVKAPIEQSGYGTKQHSCSLQAPWTKTRPASLLAAAVQVLGTHLFFAAAAPCPSLPWWWWWCWLTAAAPSSST